MEIHFLFQDNWIFFFYWKTLLDLDNKFYRNEYKNLLKNISSSFPNKVGYYIRGKEYNQIQHLTKLPFAGLGVDSGISLQNFFSDSKFGFIQGNFNENHLLLDSKNLSNELQIAIH